MASLAAKALAWTGEQTGLDFLGELQETEDSFHKSIFGSEDIGEWFVPQMPEVPEIDPVAEQSALATAQSEERSLINRAGLQTTKKVRSLLGREQALGG